MKERIPFDYRLKSLLVIAGLSCSGKSTLMELLKCKKLPQEIRPLLPADVSSWQVVNARRASGFRKLLKQESAPARGQIQHCDITGSYFPEIQKLRPLADQAATYTEEDAHFKRCLASADEIYAIIVRATPTQLLNHVAVRSAMVHVPPFARRRAARHVKHLTKFQNALPDWTADIAKKLGSRWLSRTIAREQYYRLIEQYKECRDLDAINDDWAGWFAKECGSRLRDPVLYLQPVLDAGGQMTFRLARAGDLQELASSVSCADHDPNMSPKSV